ncbi:MAG: rhodanese-like domain-containing protein [Gemmatimonadota bacterium]
MINRLLGFTALLLGGSALLVPDRPAVDSAGTPSPAHHDLVAAESLAARIMANGTAGLTLVDLRAPTAFDSYHIPGAVRLEAGELGQARLPEANTIVLYDDAESSAAGVWLLLKAQGYASVYVLSGGMAAWKDEVLHPALPPGMARETEARFGRQMELSRFFGGSPVPAPARRITPPSPRPDSAGKKKESFDIGPGGCFY